jgi:hypothetical protein
VSSSRDKGLCDGRQTLMHPTGCLGPAGTQIQSSLKAVTDAMRQMDVSLTLGRRWATGVGAKSCWDERVGSIGGLCPCKERVGRSVFTLDFYLSWMSPSARHRTAPGSTRYGIRASKTGFPDGTTHVLGHIDDRMKWIKPLV